MTTREAAAQAAPRPEAGRVAALLHEAAETHHTVYLITDGADADWASWYAEWLIRLSELPEVIGRAPVRSDLVHLLVDLDREYTRARPNEPWESWYADRVVAHFSA